MKKIKYILGTLTLTAAFTAAPTVASEACSYHLSWDLVDSNKKIDWDGSTVYSTAWDHAVTTWNNMGAVKIQPDSWNVIEDANIADYNDSSKGEQLVLLGETLNGTLDFLPSVGKKYLFIANVNAKGELVVKYASGNMPLNDGKMLSNDPGNDVKEWVENEIPFERERYKSSYAAD